jgi:hypothetical protein
LRSQVLHFIVEKKIVNEAILQENFFDNRLEDVLVSLKNDGFIKKNHGIFELS